MILVQEPGGSTRYWMVLNIVYALSIMLKYTYNPIYRKDLDKTTDQEFHKIWFMETLNTITKFLFGAEGYVWDMVSLLIIINLLHIQNSIGMGKKYISTLEDPAKCMIRIIVNDSFVRLYDKAILRSQTILLLTTIYLEDRFSKLMTTENLKRLKLEFARHIIKTNLIVKEWRNKFEYQAKLLTVAVSQDVFTNITKQESMSFLRRNFSV